MNVRLSNFEALRILCAILIAFVHANFYLLGTPHVDWSFGGFSVLSFRVFAQLLCFPATYAFAILSGYFGIKIKLKSVLNLFFMLFFWKALGQCKFCAVHGFDWATALHLNPLVGWFIPAYVTMLFFVPALNALVDQLGEVKLKNYLLVAIPCVMILDVAQLIKDFAYGYSAVGLMIGYLIGRYFSMNLKRGGGLSLRSWKWYLGGYAIMIVCGGIVYLLALALCSKIWNWEVVPVGFHRLFSNYIGPFGLTASSLLFLGFARIKFQSGLINHVARSAFPIIGYHMALGYSIMRSYYNSHSGLNVLLMMIGFVFCVIGAIVTIDQVRIWMWNKIWTIVGDFNFGGRGEKG